MAQDTSLTALNGGADSGSLNCLQVFARVIDFATENLASADHFPVFSIPANSQVVAGQLEVLTVDAGGGTISMGVGGTGTGLLNAQAISSATAVKLTAGGVITTTADTVDLLANTAAITTAKVRITMLVLVPSPLSVHG